MPTWTADDFKPKWTAENFSAYSNVLKKKKKKQQEATAERAANRGQSSAEKAGAIRDAYGARTETPKPVMLSTSTPSVTMSAAAQRAANREANAGAIRSAYGARQFAQLKDDIKDLQSRINNSRSPSRNLTDELQKMQDQYAAMLESTEKNASVGQIALNSAMHGLSQFNKGMFSTLDFILPTELLGEKYDFVSKLNERYANDELTYSENLQKSVADRSKAAQVAAEIGSGTVAALPNAILAIMTGGTALGAEAMAAPAASSGVLATAKASIQQMMKNPQYWTSLAQTLGTDYEEAKENGASEIAAIASAFISSMLNAGVEIGGGIETLPSNLKTGGKNAVLEWVKSALEEGREEAVQGVISRLTQKAIYDKDKPLFSVTDDTAVFNPINMGKEFALGAAVGGILGGGQTLGVSAINAGINRENARALARDAKNVAVPRSYTPETENAGNRKITAFNPTAAERADNLRRVGEFSEKLGKAAKTVFGQVYDGTEPADLFENAAMPYYRAGKKGESFESAKPVNNVVELLDKAKEMLYDAGKSDALALNNRAGYTVSKNINTEVTTDGEGRSDKAAGRMEQASTESTTGISRRVSTDDTGRPAERGNAAQENSTVAVPLGKRKHVAEAFENNAVVPKEGSTANEIVKRAKSDYNLESIVVPDDVWKEVRAQNGYSTTADVSAYNGKIYMSENVSEDNLRIAVPHEATHAMKQMSFTPYTEFLSGMRDRISFSNPDFRRVLFTLTEHADISIDTASENETVWNRIFDELNASVYAHAVNGEYAGKFVDGDYLDFRDVFDNFDEYFAELDRIHTQFKNRNIGTSDISYAKDTQNSASASEWTTERVGEAKAKTMRLSEIVDKARRDFGINVTTGHIRKKNVLGQYNTRSEGVRLKTANDITTLAHELGHHLDNMYKITRGGLNSILQAELINNMAPGFRSAYKRGLWVSEGFAEFIRNYLTNKEQTTLAYPDFTKHFLNTLNGTDAAHVEQLADEINAYLSQDTDTATSAIWLSEDAAKDTTPWREKIKEKANALYTAFDDTLHGIKEFDKAIGANTYKLASNSAYSDAIAGQIIVGDLTDANGRVVAPGLNTALSGINLNDKTEYLKFGEYLACKHGPERLAEGMDIFADPRKNKASWMNRRVQELDVKYPAFAEAADRLYEFNRNLRNTWLVNTGLLSEETAKKWDKRWEFYMPLNRVVGEGSGGAKKGFANQNSTIKRAHGSGLEIIHPVDNVINNIVKYVNAGVRNNVMREITDSAEKLGSAAEFLEKVPAPLKVTKYNSKSLKAELRESGKALLDESAWEAYGNIINEIDDVLLQYGAGKAYGDVVTVMKDGKPEYWKINDPLLLRSITTMAPPQLKGVLDAYAVISRFVTGNITGNNLIWSIFSNLPRDLMSTFIYSKDKNVIKLAGGIGSAYANKFKSAHADPLYKEFLAMGGGQTSAYSADRNLAANARKKLARKQYRERSLEAKFVPGKAYSFNPLDGISFLSDAIESGPRFATYKVMRENGMTPQDAFYEAMDITVNFRRGGYISREINKFVPFFNAGVQGVDKMARWLSAQDAPKDVRAKVIRGRLTAFAVFSAIAAALTFAINSKDEEAKEDYAQLSNYTKNTYFCIPMGDGKYFAIPKPRELGVLTSFFETCMEYFVADNKHAFDEFYNYAATTMLPNVVADIAQGDFYGAIGSLGIIGTGAYMMANRDFLGRPIEAAGLEILEPKDRYTDRTGQVAYWLGQAFNKSPQKIDFFLDSVFGGWNKVAKALFPVGEQNRDYFFGVRNQYVKDNQHSTDLTNRLYDKKEKSTQASNSDPSDIEKKITAKMDGNMTTFYSRYNKLSKNNSTSSRGTRQVVLDTVYEYLKAADNKSVTAAEQAVYDICKAKGSTDYLPSVMQSAIKDADEKTHELSDVRYAEYQLNYNRLYWEFIEETLPNAKTNAEKAEIVLKAKTLAKEQATEKVLKQIGAPTEKNEYAGVNNSDVLLFLAKLELAEAEHEAEKAKAKASGKKFTDTFGQEDWTEIIKNMDLDKEDRAILWQSQHPGTGKDPTKNNPWREYLP